MIQKQNKSQLHTLISNEALLKVLDDSENYLSDHKEITMEIDSYLWVFRSLHDLIPQVIEKIGSGHNFPIIEAEYEVEGSVQLCKLGFYKHAIVSLRNVLELSLLSVYWDIDDNSHIDIQRWINALENTPFKKEIFKKLSLNNNISLYDTKMKLFTRVDSIYAELSNYSHTKGIKYSSRSLSNSNVNIFQERTFLYWVQKFKEVIRLAILFHVLKYPVALQYIPLDEKFGLNGPVGGFLRPNQMESLKNIFDKEEAHLLQQISDNDKEAISLADGINALPDLTEEEFEKQIIEFDRSMIKMSGF